MILSDIQFLLILAIWIVFGIFNVAVGVAMQGVLEKYDKAWCVGLGPILAVFIVGMFLFGWPAKIGTWIGNKIYNYRMNN